MIRRFNSSMKDDMKDGFPERLKCDNIILVPMACHGNQRWCSESGRFAILLCR